MINSGIAQVRSSTADIEQFHAKALTAISEEQSAQQSQELDELMTRTNKIIAKTRANLKAMEESNKKEGADPKSKTLNADQRIRISQVVSLYRNFVARHLTCEQKYTNCTKRFMTVVKDFQNIQTKYKDKYKQRLQRQYKIGIFEAL